LALSATDAVILYSSDLSRPQGGYNPPPPYSCDTPNHLKFKGGYQGCLRGVYVIVMEEVINVVKY